MPYIHSAELKSLVYDIAVYNSEPAYKRLFGLLFNSLFRLSFCMLKSRELSEEVSSDVMFKLWQKRWEMLQVDNVQVYALTIARNLSLNALKQQSAKRTIPLDELKATSLQQAPNPEQLMIASQNTTLIADSINALPTRCRIVFKLIKEDGMSYREVAEVLNISPKTVDAHLVTAMKKLSGALKPSCYLD